MHQASQGTIKLPGAKALDDPGHISAFIRPEHTPTALEGFYPMTEEEIEVVAEELAKIGGVSWYSGREKGSLVRVVCDRYRERARLAIEALERCRAIRDAALIQDNERPPGIALPHYSYNEDIKPGSTVIYRPPGDRRAYPCRVVEIEGNRAYLAPILRACTEWVSIEHLVPSREADKAVAHE